MKPHQRVMQSVGNRRLIERPECDQSAPGPFTAGKCRALKVCVESVAR